MKENGNIEKINEKNHIEDETDTVLVSNSNIETQPEENMNGLVDEVVTEENKQSAGDRTNGKSTSERNSTWVSRFLGNKKTKSANDTPTAIDEEVSSEHLTDEIEHQDANEIGVEDTSTFNGSEVGMELISQHGELSTIPEAKEEEEEQQDEDPTAEDDKGKKKKSSGFSFWNKFGLASTAVKQPNQTKCEDANGTSQTDDKDIEGGEENFTAKQTINGDANIKPNPIQQYVFGWDEDDTNKNNTHVENDRTQFQDNSSVTVPVA